MTTKLHKLQTKVQAISRDATNPFYKSKYFDINGLLRELKPLLNEIGLTIIQPFGVQDGKSILETIILDGETGAVIESSKIFLPDNIDPQKMGSAITYYRRYSLQSMLLLEAEDDDANSTVKAPPKTPVQAQPQVDEITCDSCHGINIKHLVGTAKSTGKPYDFWKCEECGHTWNE